MRRLRLAPIALLLALLLGQLFALAHASQHELGGNTVAHCELCALAHAPALPASTGALLLSAVPAAETDSLPVENNVYRRLFDRPPARGPPVARALLQTA